MVRWGTLVDCEVWITVGCPPHTSWVLRCVYVVQQLRVSCEVIDADHVHQYHHYPVYVGMYVRMYVCMYVCDRQSTLLCYSNNSPLFNRSPSTHMPASRASPKVHPLIQSTSVQQPLSMVPSKGDHCRQ